MRIAQNITALNVNLRLRQTQNKIGQASARMASGFKIMSSKDDPAGLAISNRMDSQVTSMSQANQNALDGTSLIQTAEGALAEIGNITQRLRELSVQSANGTLTDSDREKIQIEGETLLEEINSISKKTTFNGINLLSGESMDPTLNYDAVDDPTNVPIVMLQVGQDKNMNFRVELDIISVDTLGLTGLDFSTQQSSEAALTLCDAAITQVNAYRAKYGAYENALGYTTSNLESLEENLTTSLSRIRDADLAKEMTIYTQNSVISQAGISMLAQANARPQEILQLLK